MSAVVFGRGRLGASHSYPDSFFLIYAAGAKFLGVDHGSCGSRHRPRMRRLDETPGRGGAVTFAEPRSYGLTHPGSHMMT
eukprot:28560-Pelagococcus_subviridis.AAC.3